MTQKTRRIDLGPARGPLVNKREDQASKCHSGSAGELSLQYKLISHHMNKVTTWQLRLFGNRGSR